MKRYLQSLKRILSNPYTLSIVSKVFGVVVGLLFTIFQARYLGAEIKGQVATVNSIVSITSIVCGLGIAQSYPYFRRKSETDVLPVFMKLSLLMLVVYGVISAAVIVLLDLPPEIIASLIITPLLTYDGIVSYITLVEEPNRRSLTDMAVLIMELLLLIVLWIVAPPTFVIGVIIITAKDVTKAAFFTGWLRKKIFVPSESLREWIPRLVVFGVFPMLSVLMTTLNYRVDILMMRGLGVANASIGIYSVGVQLAERIWMIPDAMRGVMVSKITKGKDARETAYVIRVCNSVCLIVAAGIIILGKPFLDIAFGPQYHGSYQVTLILLAGVFALIYYKMIAAYNVAMGKQIITFFLLTISVICNIVANYFLIPVWGIYGAGLASVISYGVCAILFIIYFCRATGISFKEMLFLNREEWQHLKKRFRRKKGGKQEKTPELAGDRNLLEQGEDAPAESETEEDGILEDGPDEMPEPDFEDTREDLYDL